MINHINLIKCGSEMINLNHIIKIVYLGSTGYTGQEQITVYLTGERSLNLNGERAKKLWTSLMRYVVEEV